MLTCKMHEVEVSTVTRTPLAANGDAYNYGDMARPPKDALDRLADITGYPAETVALWFTTPDQALDVDGMAEYLGVHKNTVYLLLQRGDLPARKVGREWRISAAGLARWVDGRKVDPGSVRAEDLAG